MKHTTLRRALVAGIAATLLLATAGCARPGETPGASEGGATGEPIRIGFTGVLSGPSASAGKGLLEGLELQIDRINEDGGLLGGREIQLVERDHGANPDTAVANIRELIEKENVAALIGESTTGPLLATASIANEAGVPWVIAGATGTAATQQPNPNYIFRVSLVDNEQTGFVAAQALERGSKVALLTDTSGLGQGGRKDLLAALTAAGTQPVADETFNVGDTDMTAQLSRVQAAGADVVIFWGVGPEAAQVRRGMESLGMLETPMLANWGLGMPNYPELAGELANGTSVVQAFSFHENQDPQALAVQQAYQKKFGTDRMTFAQELVNAYDAMGLLADAIERAGGTDRDAIRDALLEAKYDGLMKSYDAPWSETQREALTAEDLIMTEMREGILVPVETK